MGLWNGKRSPAEISLRQNKRERLHTGSLFLAPIVDAIMKAKKERKKESLNAFPFMIKLWQTSNRFLTIGTTANIYTVVVESASSNDTI